MNGVMMPGVSAGSNQVGASETWTPQVSCPSGPAALARRGAPAATTKAANANASRRVTAGWWWLVSGFARLRRVPIDFPPVLSASVIGPVQFHFGGRRARRKISGLLDRDVFVGGCVGVARHQAEARFPDSWANAVEETELPDRRVDFVLSQQQLHFV